MTIEEKVSSILAVKESIETFKTILENVKKIKELPTDDRLDVAYRIAISQRAIDGINKSLSYLGTFDSIRLFNSKELEDLNLKLVKSLDSQTEILQFIKDILENKVIEEEKNLETEKISIEKLNLPFRLAI